MFERIPGPVDPRAVRSVREWTPETASAALLAWYQADQETGFSDDDPMTVITDQSGLGRHLTGVDSTGSNPVLWKDDGDGKPYYYSQPSGQYMVHTTFPALTDKPRTLFIAGNLDADLVTVHIGDFVCNKSFGLRINAIVVWCNDTFFTDFEDIPSMGILSYKDGVSKSYLGKDTYVEARGVNHSFLDTAMSFSLFGFPWDGSSYFEGCKVFSCALFNGALPETELARASAYFRNLMN